MPQKPDEWVVVEPPKPVGRTVGAGPITNMQLPVKAQPEEWEVVEEEAPPQEPNLWDKLNTPLWEGPSRLGRSMAEFLTDPRHMFKDERLAPYLNPMIGYGAGTLEGLGDLVSGLTSPLGIATAGVGAAEVGAAKAGLPAAAKLLGYGTKALSAPYVVSGGGKVVKPDASLQERAMGLAELAGGMAGVIHTPPGARPRPRPNINPAVAESVAGLAPEVIPPSVGAPTPISKGRPPSSEVKILSSIESISAAQSPNARARLVEFLEQDLANTTASPEIVAQAQQVIADVRAANPDAFTTPVTEPTSTAQFIETMKQADQVSSELGSMRAEDTMGAIPRPGDIPPTPNVPPVRIKLKNPTPENVKEAMRQGYVFEGVNDDTSFSMVRSNKPVEPPVLEQEIPNQRGGKSVPQGRELPPEASGPLSWNNLRRVGKTGDEALDAAISRYKALRSKSQKGALSESEKMELFTLEQSLRDNPRLSPPIPVPMGQGGGNIPPPPPGMGGGGNVPPPTGGGPTVTPPVPRGALETTMDVANFPRAVMASIDFSAPLRQGLPLIHKKAFWTSLDDMFKAWGSEAAYRQIQDDIRSKPLFRERTNPVTGTTMPSFADESGLKLTDLDGPLSGREESLASRYAEKIPGVRRANRAYTVFLNKLRADTFESLVTNSNVFGANATANLPLSKSLAEFVNYSSGRGSLGKFEKAAGILNTGLFSPRLMASRLKILNPATYIFAPPQVRKEGLKSLLAIAATGNTILQLGKMAGGEVVSDPNSSDFGKLKLGNVRVDPFGGFQQYIVAANRLVRPGWMNLPVGETDTGAVPFDLMMGLINTGGQQFTSSTSGNTYDLWEANEAFDPTHMDVAARFLRGKLNPVLGFIWSLMAGQKELSGQPMNFTAMGIPGMSQSGESIMDNSIAQRFIPIIFQDIYSLLQEDPGFAALLGAYAAFGGGVQRYEEK